MLRLVPLAGPQKGQAIEMAPGSQVGRGVECQLRLPHASVSRIHARLEQRGTAWFAVDQGSRNGLRLGQKRLAECELADGQRLYFGEFPVRVLLGAGAAKPDLGAAEELEFVDQLEGLELLQTRSVPRTPGAAPDLAAESGELSSLVGGLDEGLPQRDSAPGEGGLTLEDPAQIQLEAAGRPAPPAGPAAQARERQAEFLRSEQRARNGLWRGDFEQLSFAQQALLFLVASAVLIGIAALIASLIAGAN